MKQNIRAKQIFKVLKKLYPHAKCSLNHETPFQLLVATILSAQCTDQRVNIVTKDLFKKFPGPCEMAQAKLSELENIIHSTGFFKVKAKNIKNMSLSILENFHGKIPQDLDLLISLPGVGRKTANVVLGNAFKIISGIVVDTHVIRLSKLLGLTKQKTPEKIEKDLIRLFPKKDWVLLSHLFILHGRSTCIARRPLCDQCVLKTDCPSAQI